MEKRLTDKMKSRQYRDVTFELIAKEQEEKSYIVEGYATTFGPYTLYEYSDGTEVKECFSAETFKNCDMSDVIFQYNHEGRVFARQSNGTLQLEIDDKGLKVWADLSKTSSSRQMYEDIEAGLVTKMSWGFITGEYHFDKESNTIVHDSVRKIFDVSAVSIPANDNTNINARAFADGVISDAIEEFEKMAKERKLKELKLKLKLGGFLNEN